MARLFHRLAADALEASLADTPVVLVHGPRQCGKTTLAQTVGEARGYTYLTFDDPVTLGSAMEDPAGFVSELPARVILDEVQRVPGLFTAIKRVVDRERTPGRFLLTGSANVLLVPTLADSLAGRMGLLRLHPLAQAEVSRRSPRLIDSLFERRLRVRRVHRLGKTLATRVAAGGFPAALARKQAPRRAAWYRDYIETIVQRDVRDMTRIASLDILPRLLALAAGQSARLINVSDLAGPFQVSRPTIRDYVTVLQRVFLIDELQPWHRNRLSRLVKTPKLHVADTGLASALLGLDADALWADKATFGQLLETFVYQELRRLASGESQEVRFHHYRDRDGYEVDIVLERGAGDIVGVEVKAGATVTAADFRGLRKLQEAAGDRFMAGVVMYDGETSARFGEGLFAMPTSALWDF